MTLFSLRACCLSLGVDPKTLRVWLKAAHFSCAPHPTDARLKCLTPQQLEQIASLHQRPLSLLPPAPVQESQVVAGEILASEAPQTASMREQLTSLHEQVALLQARVDVLTRALHACQSPSNQVSDALPLTPPASCAPQSTPSSTDTTTPAPQPSPVQENTSPHPERPRARARSRALPLIQICPDGSVVVIDPVQGVLPLLPDSPAWFAWLTSIDAFSFECPNGRFSATRKFHAGQRIQSWNVHCSMHGRSCTLYLGLTVALSLARLQQMVGAVRTRLSSH